ncbi:MAG: restriction endonuclease subunit S [Prevotella sp.]|nr:restriction endonuclease subunit S [Candidatus Equicola faecalis]
MESIEQMIKRLCPEGVQYVKLGEYYKRIKGTPITATKMKEIASKDGEIRIFAGGRTIIDAHEKDIPNANITRVPAVLVQSRGIIDVIFYDKPFTFKNEMWAYTIDNSTSIKFLYYILKNNIDYFRDVAFGMGSLPQISIGVTENFLIPLPPMEVQERIVEVLDKMTALTAELQAELQARKQQYEYYRNQLLTHFAPDEPVREYSLGELGTFTKGAGILKSDFRKSGYPCIHYGQIHTYYGTFTNSTISFVEESYAIKLRKAKYGNLIITTTSEDVEACCKACAWMGDKEVAVSGDAHIYSHNQNPKYMAYLFQTDLFAKQKRLAANGVKVIRVKGEAMAKFKFKFPSLEEQERIVSILDKFEVLVNDLSQGLPAEIEARRQQYEHYRNRLLTFERR